MELSKKQNEIKVLAKYLLKVLFKGEAELSLDNDKQVVIYTGHTMGPETGNIYSVSCTEFLNAD